MYVSFSFEVLLNVCLLNSQFKTYKLNMSFQKVLPVFRSFIYFRGKFIRQKEAYKIMTVFISSGL